MAGTAFMHTPSINLPYIALGKFRPMQWRERNERLLCALPLPFTSGVISIYLRLCSSLVRRSSQL